MQGINPNYWEGFDKLNDKIGKRNVQQQRRRKMEKVKHLLAKYGFDKLHKEINAGIANKMDELISTNEAYTNRAKAA